MHYNVCAPLVSTVSKHIATNATIYKAPAAKMGAMGSSTPSFAATSGAQIPAILFKRLAIPDPVPRTGAGNTSAV